MISFSYDYKSITLFDNEIGPDKTNTFFHDSDPNSSTATINVYGISTGLITFNRSDTNTVYQDWDHGNDTWVGSWAAPVKSLEVAFTKCDANRYQIGIKTSTNNS